MSDHLTTYVLIKEKQNEFLAKAHMTRIAKQARTQPMLMGGTLLKRLSFIFMLAFALSSNAQGNTTEPYVVKGRVVDWQGRPLENVQIVVDNTVYYNSAMISSTDTNGEYYVRVEDGSWRVYAEMNREYNGRTYEIDLMADTFNSFAGMDGAARNFVWQLQGEKARTLGWIFWWQRLYLSRSHDRVL